MKLNIRKLAVAVVATVAGGGLAIGQSAIDAYNISQTSLRGTARFVAMGGAFTSLGGDISTLSQNPAGIGMYRKSEMAVSMDFNFRRFTTTAGNDVMKSSKNPVYFDNVGYVGTQRLNGAMRNFNWGVSYSRVNSFQRNFSGYNSSTSTSMSNYIASFTNGINSDELAFSENYNPYKDSGYDWMSILAYNTFMINNPGSDRTQYQGLYGQGTKGDAYYEMRENGYVDEYSIDLGGNVSDLVYWGLGVGIQDMSYTREGMYSESMENANVFNPTDGRLVKGNAGFNLLSRQNISGTGCNLKFGLIVRPIDELRIGVAVHTPTWYHLNHYGDGEVDFNYTPNGSTKTHSGNEYTDTYDFDSRINTPWRLMFGASTVLGGRAIVSLDYEYQAYNNMSVKYQQYNSYGWGGSFVADEAVNSDIKTYFMGTSIVRLGLEYRLTSNWSLRAGYNYQTGGVRSDVLDNRVDVSTSGTDLSYTLNRSTQYLSCGIGYRYGGWYIDAAYQWRHRNSDFHPYTPFDSYADTPSCKLDENIHSLTLTTGFRF